MTDKNSGKLEATADGASPTVDSVPAVEEPSMTFDMYCIVRRIAVQRRPGMRVFTAVDKATVAQWDEIFRRY